MMRQKKHIHTSYNCQVLGCGVLVGCLLVLAPASGWALQTHGAPEGIYVHQLAHVLFMAALGYLYWHTRKTQHRQSSGWRYLQVFCVLLSLWNGAAFLGHEMLGHLSAMDLINRGTWQEELALPFTPTKLVYYVTRLDHLLFVPALAALVISLRTFCREAERGGSV